MRRIYALTFWVVFGFNANAQSVRETQEYVDAAYARMWRQKHRHAEQPLLATPPPCCQWTTPVPIDSSMPGQQFGGYMTLDDAGNIYVTWSWGPSIVIQRSSDRGNSWRRMEYLGPEPGRAPRDIAADHSGNLWLLLY